MSNHLHNSKIANRYAKALFEISAAAEADAVVLESLQNFAKIVADCPDLMKFLTNPVIPSDEKLTLLTEQFKGNVPEHVWGLLRLLLHNERFGTLLAVIEQFEALYNKRHFIANAEVTAASPLNPQQEEKLAQQLENLFGYKTVHVQTQVDPQILGGLVVKLSDQIIDGSYAGKLAALAKTT